MATGSSSRSRRRSASAIATDVLPTPVGPKMATIGSAAATIASNTASMKLQATIVISYRADSFADAGGALDDVLRRARERDDVEIESIQLSTPSSAGPVSLPYVE